MSFLLLDLLLITEQIYGILVQFITTTVELNFHKLHLLTAAIGSIPSKIGSTVKRFTLILSSNRKHKNEQSLCVLVCVSRHKIINKNK